MPLITVCHIPLDLKGLRIIFFLTFFWIKQIYSCWMFLLLWAHNSVYFIISIFLKSTTAVVSSFERQSFYCPLSVALSLSHSLSHTCCIHAGLFLRSLKYSLPTLTDRLMHSAFKICPKSLLRLSGSWVEVYVLIILQVDKSKGLKSNYNCLSERLWHNKTIYVSLSKFSNMVYWHNRSLCICFAEAFASRLRTMCKM